MTDAATERLSTTYTLGTIGVLLVGGGLVADALRRGQVGAAVAVGGVVATVAATLTYARILVRRHTR